MKRNEFDEAAKKYDYSEREKEVQKLVVLRNEFVKHFNTDFIKKRKLED